MEPGRLEVIKTFNTQGGIDELTNRFLQQSHRKRTHQLYNRRWSLWTSWCKKQQLAINNLQYELKNILKLLVQQQYYSYQYLNVIRSSVGSIFKIVHKDKPPLAQHPLILEFFVAKKRSEVILPNKQQLETWDLDILLQYMVKDYSNNDILSLPQLQEKAILLLCIAMMWRPRSDIGTLQARDIEFSYINEGSSTTQIVTGMTLHIRQPKEKASQK
ncbi:hypothetical protein RMCBS344292_12336 [Rhizopus microsporus]|nr:hypothetical protein RMCBS344292_12336 [Rhizopus microsporus]